MGLDKAEGNCYWKLETCREIEGASFIWRKLLVWKGTLTLTWREKEEWERWLQKCNVHCAHFNSKDRLFRKKRARVNNTFL